jgi:hypothetical protein
VGSVLQVKKSRVDKAKNAKKDILDFILVDLDRLKKWINRGVI